MEELKFKAGDKIRLTDNYPEQGKGEEGIVYETSLSPARSPYTVKMNDGSLLPVDETEIEAI